MNSVVIAGRVGQDPDIKYYESGKIKTVISVAVDRWDSKTKTNVADWFRVEVWDKKAEFVGQYVKKGSSVVVEGRISTSRWKDQTGEEREMYLINASDVKFFGSKREAEQ